MKLYFQTSSGNRALIGEPENRAEAFRILNQFLSDHKFTSHYMRVWTENGEIWIDVGSWSEFFILTNES